MNEPVLIIGGGPAGSASAMNLLRHGFQPLIVESETFPRYHIGESLTTECVDALNRLGLAEELIKLGAPKKQGVRIFSSDPKNSFYVGAGDAWQVEREKFDAMMLETAVKRGAAHIQGRVRKLDKKDDQWCMKIERSDGEMMERTARFAIDASGQQRFSVRQGLIGPLKKGNYANQIALFSQYCNVAKRPEDAYDTLIFHRETHEWAWMIPLSETRYSIGLVLPVNTYKKDKQSMEAFLDTRLNTFTPPLVERVALAERVAEVRAVSSYSYKVDNYAANGLFCVGDSHAFIDPIFSFGVEFSVLEAAYMAKALKACSVSNLSEWEAHARQYMDVTANAQSVIQDMLNYFWAHPWGFAHMAHARHKDEFLELFAGRIYEIEPGEGLQKMRANNT